MFVCLFLFHVSWLFVSLSCFLVVCFSFMFLGCLFLFHVSWLFVCFSFMFLGCLFVSLSCFLVVCLFVSLSFLGAKEKHKDE